MHRSPEKIPVDEGLDIGIPHALLRNDDVRSGAKRVWVFIRFLRTDRTGGDLMTHRLFYNFHLNTARCSKPG